MRRAFFNGVYRFHAFMTGFFFVTGALSAKNGWATLTVFNAFMFMVELIGASHYNAYRRRITGSSSRRVTSKGKG